MLTNTEQKLSALKAINEEKETVDHSLEVLSTQPDSLTIMASSMNPKAQTVETFLISGSVAKEVVDVLKEYYADRKLVLIDKAESLMKSE